MKPIPSPRSLPVLGTMLSVVAAGGASKLHLYVDRRHKELGPIYREKIGPVSGVFVSDGNYMRKIFGAEGKYPKHIVPDSWLLYNKIYKCKRGLLFMDGEEWFTFRKIMNDVMLKVKQDEFFAAVNLVADDLIQSFGKGGKIVDLEERLYKWSLDVIVAILLGPESYANNKTKLSSKLEELAKTVHVIFIESAKLSLIPVNLAIKLKIPAWKRFVLGATSVVEQSKSLLDDILRLGTENSGRGSVLSEMLDIGMALADLKRIVTDLILAAGDTTAHTTQWLLHLLSADLPLQTVIYSELKEFREKEIYQNPLLKGALKEALRLYPVAPFLTRFLPNDLVLDEYRIRADELVLMSLYSSGRNKEFFPNPESFSPQRWVRNGKTYKGVINPNASLPFAMGSRSCIGKKIAEIQILVAISKILKNFVVRSGNTKRIDITLHLISVPAEPICLILEPREKSDVY